MSQDNGRLVQRLFDSINSRKDITELDQFFSADYLSHNPELPPGLAGVRQFFAMLRTAFPDGALTLDEANVAGDRVTVRSTLHGTHQGDVWGYPPTGKPVQVSWTDTWRIADGKLVEHWGGINRDELSKQLGERPTPVPEGGTPPKKKAA